jgi:hypothetical protein
MNQRYVTAESTASVEFAYALMGWVDACPDHESGADLMRFIYGVGM